MKLDNEKHLLKRIAEGDHAAFGMLVKELGPYLYAQVIRVSSNHELAEEVVQDVFVQIWQAREALDGINNMSGYLFTLSRNKTIDMLRKEAAQRKLKVKWQAEQTAKNETIEQEIDQYNILDQAVNALPPQQQKVWIMSRRMRMKYEDIAKALQISKDAVNKYLQAATRNITKWIHEHGGPDIFPLIILFFFN